MFYKKKKKKKIANSRFTLAATPGAAGSKPLKLSERTRFLLATPQPSCDDRAFEDERYHDLSSASSFPGLDTIITQPAIKWGGRGDTGADNLAVHKVRRQLKPRRAWQPSDIASH